MDYRELPKNYCPNCGNCGGRNGKCANAKEPADEWTHTPDGGLKHGKLTLYPATNHGTERAQ